MVDKNYQQYISIESKKVYHFLNALNSESDRGCALFAAAFLDELLSDMLKALLVDNEKIDQEILKDTAPLSTFSSRIKIAYYLGLISKKCKNDLNIIRGIRNRFAHDSEINSFEMREIRDRCLSLDFSFRPKKAKARSHFISSVVQILGIIIKTKYEIEHIIEKIDDPPIETHKEAYQNLIDKKLEALLNVPTLNDPIENYENYLKRVQDAIKEVMIYTDSTDSTDKA